LDSAPRGSQSARNGKRLYVADSAANDVTVVDLETRRPVARIPVGVDPLAIAISPDGRAAYVSNHANSTITPLDLQTNEAATPIEVGGAPLGISFTSDGKQALVLLSRDNAGRICRRRCAPRRRPDSAWKRTVWPRRAAGGALTLGLVELRNRVAVEERGELAG
jgi:YVTN family beta-propeller protein